MKLSNAVIMIESSTNEMLADKLLSARAEFANLIIKSKTWPTATSTDEHIAEPRAHTDDAGDDEFERGIFLREGVRVCCGEILLRIPREMLITVKVARNECSVGQKMWTEEEKLEALLAEEDIDWNEDDDDEDVDDAGINEEGSESREDSGNEGDRVDVAGIDLSSLPHAYLASFILEDRKRSDGTESRFRAYYRSLPQALPHIPLFWCDVCLCDLTGGSYVYRQVLDQRAALIEDYRETCRVAPGFREVATFAEYCWARMIVASRAFGLQLDRNPHTKRKRPPLLTGSGGDIGEEIINGGGKHQLCSEPEGDEGDEEERGDEDEDHDQSATESVLVPFADMINHRRPRQTIWSFETDHQKDSDESGPSSTSSSGGYFTLKAAQVI
jgi:hypothetical protein